MISPDPKAGYFWRGVQYVARGGDPGWAVMKITNGWVLIQAGVFTGPGDDSDGGR